MPLFVSHKQLCACYKLLVGHKQRRKYLAEVHILPTKNSQKQTQSTL
jgi:hypothetical protein